VTTLPRPAVYLVTDRRRLTPDARTTADELRALEALLVDALDAGVDAIQIREPDLDAAALLALVRRIVARAAGLPTGVLVNDRVDVAMAARAHGIHLRGDGFPVGEVRQLEPDWIIGRSVHGTERLDVHRAADYLLFGTVYATASKPANWPIAGIRGLEAAVSRSAVPVLAIGGITPARARDCHRAGAAGVAAIGLFLPEGRTPDALGVRRAIADLRAAMTGN
jgi:thiamine-phosphate pyrophosphorylase